MKYLIAMLLLASFVGSVEDRISMSVKTVSLIEDPVVATIRGTTLCAPRVIGESIDYTSPEFYIYFVVEYPADCDRMEMESWVAEKVVDVNLPGIYTLGVYEIDDRSYYQPGMEPAIEKRILVLESIRRIWIPGIQR